MEVSHPECLAINTHPATLLNSCLLSKVAGASSRARELPPGHARAAKWTKSTGRDRRPVKPAAPRAPRPNRVSGLRPASATRTRHPSSSRCRARRIDQQPNAGTSRICPTAGPNVGRERGARRRPVLAPRIAPCASHNPPLLCSQICEKAIMQPAGLHVHFRRLHPCR
jgi:hypothetical protein